MYRQTFKARKPNHATPCKCDHEQVCHYTPDGHCIYQICGCTQFRPKGRPEYATAKRGRCDHGHAHDSRLEVVTCADLTNLKKAGEIKEFQFHPLVRLLGPSGQPVATYEVDFKVEKNDGIIQFIECKGRHLEKDPAWRLKWALLNDLYRGDPGYEFQVILG